jgi:hypothetical protein
MLASASISMGLTTSQHLWSSPCVVVGGGEDGPLLSGNAVIAISPTPIVPRVSCWQRHVVVPQGGAPP